MFTQSPGYSEGINLALDANDRRAASRGMLGSGNTIADTTKLATDYASQKFGDYRGGLAPYLTQGTAAAGGIGNLYSDLGKQINANYTGQGGALNANYTGQGDLAYKTQSGIGDATAAADLNKYNVSQNSFNALMSGAKLASAFI